MWACGAALKLWEMRLTPSRCGFDEAAKDSAACHAWMSNMQYVCQLPYHNYCHCLPQVIFERPVLCLGSEVCLRIGPESSVQLTTTHLDERMRLGRGSRGSRFVFVRGGPADQAGG
jgi:hypothetical protein